MDSESLEQLPAAKPGDRVLRRMKKSRGVLHNLRCGIARRFRFIGPKRWETR
jgi:hypothetical protein